MFLSKILNFFKDKTNTNTNTNEDSLNKVTIDIQTEKNIDLDENNKQIATSIVSSIIEGVKIMMASLLSIFVPQYCPETGTTCSMSENFSNLSSFNEFVIFFNFLTLAFFVKLILIQNKREAYFISHLDEDKNISANSLEDNIKSYPRILSRVKQHNKKLKKYTNIIIYLFIFNVLFSSILIFYYFYDGFRSVTTLLGHLLLVSSKLYNLYIVCKNSTGIKHSAYSTIHQTTISYNIPDKNYDIYNLFHTTNKNKYLIGARRKNNTFRNKLTYRNDKTKLRKMSFKNYSTKS
jgi:hypothetical protein